MKKNTYKFSVDVVFAYNIFSTDTQKNLNFTVTTDICRDNFSDAVAAFKTYVRYITHDMIELSIPDLVEKRVEGMFIVIKSEHYDCTNLICKKDTLEEAAAAVRESIAQRINKNYHTGLTGADITHENEERYRFSFDFDENCPADNSEPRVHATYDFWKGDDEESVEWAVFEVTTDKPFFLLSYEEYESIELTGFYDSFDEAFEEMKELIAESVNDVFDEDATADDVEDMEDYNVFVHSNKDSKDSGAPLAFASFCDDYPNREWTIFHI